jgi:hypothetical protein
MQTHNNLVLREEDHTYWIDQRRIIGVTEALSFLDKRWKVDPFYLERGRLVHLATEYHDRDELDESTVDERIRPYLDAYKKFRQDTGFDPAIIEQKFLHGSYWYAGKVDRIGMLNGSGALLDLKSGAPDPVDRLQVVAYWELCQANELKNIQKIFCLYLKDNGTYKLRPVEKPKLLLPVFLACLTVARWSVPIFTEYGRRGYE